MNLEKIGLGAAEEGEAAQEAGKEPDPDSPAPWGASFLDLQPRTAWEPPAPCSHVSVTAALGDGRARPVLANVCKAPGFIYRVIR